MAPNYILRLLMPNYGGWRNWIFKIPLRDCIFKAGVFSSFLKNFRAFLQIGLTYLFFVFWRFQHHQNVETRSRLARNHVLLLKICTIDLIVVLKIREDFHFIELCITKHDFTVQGLCGVTNPSPLNLISSSKLLIVTLHVIQYLNFTIQYSQIILDD